MSRFIDSGSRVTALRILALAGSFWLCVAGATQAVAQDSDADGVTDPRDNCPSAYNPEQVDADSDGLGDVCDACPDSPVVSQYRFEEGSAGQVASGQGSLLDSVDGSASGTPVDGPIYQADVALGTACVCASAANALSLEFNGDQGAFFDGQFILHQAYGDATLEFFIYVPNQNHHSIFWTRGDDDDTNRFNIAINFNGGFGFDYRSPTGELHVDDAANSLFFIPLDSWHHVAVVRIETVYLFYLDGAYQTARVDFSPYLPDSPQWSISGRECCQLLGRIDEVRFTVGALTPDEFLIADADGDGVANPCDNCPNTPNPQADLDGDCDVDGFDLALLLGQWTGAASYSPCPPQAPADLNGDCKINGFDLALLLGAWG